MSEWKSDKGLKYINSELVSELKNEDADTKRLKLASCYENGRSRPPLLVRDAGVRLGRSKRSKKSNGRQIFEKVFKNNRTEWHGYSAKLIERQKILDEK